ncbi:MAG TPA: transporter substrate-binding domain-containing protein [Ignavibacteriaceae bacterium]|nr:transporter substrate-binding domain-containing protein [Ignavibacteriaceae bacterium]
MKSALFAVSLLLIFSSCNNEKVKITSLNQLSGKRICVLTGSAGDMIARKEFPDGIFLDFAGSADAALAVKAGKADAFVYDESVLNKIVEKNSDLLILPEVVTYQEVAIAIGKENIFLKSKLDSALSILNNKGILTELKTKWVETPYAMPPQLDKVEVSKYQTTLKMGTCAIYEPYTFISNGVHTGLDIDLRNHLSKILNTNIETIDMAFEGLIPALQAGKIDFAISNFTVTDERKNYISYSTPYLKNNISVLVRR